MPEQVKAKACAQELQVSAMAERVPAAAERGSEMVEVETL
jgi:hypothetical protein